MSPTKYLERIPLILPQTLLASTTPIYSLLTQITQSPPTPAKFAMWSQCL